MSILAALTAPTTREAAIAYTQAGVSVVPLRGKQAHIMWEPFQRRVMSAREAAYWWRPNTTFNIGIILGAVSGGLVCIDLDGTDAAQLFFRQFPHFQNTLVVKTGSGEGYHCYLKTRAIPSTFRLMNVAGGNIELRSSGCYVVAPNGVHPVTGARYEISHLREPLEMDDLAVVGDWMEGLRVKKAGAEVASRAVTPARMPGDLRTMSFVEAALSRELAAVASTPPGQQNNRLNIAAFNLGQLVGDGLLSESEVENQLCQAASTFEDQNPVQNLKTIRSGLKAGIARPRSQQRR